MSSQLNSTDWDFLTAVACCVEFKVIFAKILLFYSYPHQRKHPFCKFMSHNSMLVSKCNLNLKKDPWFFKTKNDVEKWYFVTKLFWPTVRKNCSSDREKPFEIRGWRPRICKIFETTRTIYPKSESSEQVLVTECFVNLFLEIFHT